MSKQEDFFTVGFIFMFLGVLGFGIGFADNDYLDYFFGATLFIIGFLCYLRARILRKRSIIPAGSEISGAANIRLE
jgi:uncharacterized membrane protein YfcA